MARSPLDHAARGLSLRSALTLVACGDEPLSPEARVAPAAAASFDTLLPQ